MKPRSKTPTLASSTTTTASRGRIVNFAIPTSSTPPPPPQQRHQDQHRQNSRTPIASFSGNENRYHRVQNQHEQQPFIDEDDDDPNSFRFSSPQQQESFSSTSNPLFASSQTGEPKFAPSVVNMFAQCQDNPILFSGFADKWLPPQQRVNSASKQNNRHASLVTDFFTAGSESPTSHRNNHRHRYYQSKSQPCHVLTKGPQVVFAVGQRGIYLLPKERLRVRDIAEIVIHERCGSSAITRGGSPVFEFRMINERNSNAVDIEQTQPSASARGQFQLPPTAQENGIAPVVQSRFVTFGGEYIAVRVASVLRIVAPDVPIVVHVDQWPSDAPSAPRATSSSLADSPTYPSSTPVMSGAVVSSLSWSKNCTRPSSPTKRSPSEKKRQQQVQRQVEGRPLHKSSSLTGSSYNRKGNDENDRGDDDSSSSSFNEQKEAAKRWQLLKRTSAVRSTTNTNRSNKGYNNNDSIGHSTTATTSPNDALPRPPPEREDSWADFLKSRDSIRRRIQPPSVARGGDGLNGSVNFDSLQQGPRGAGHLIHVYADGLANDLVKMQSEIDNFLLKFGSVRDESG